MTHLLTLALTALTPPADPTCADTASIRWHTPGKFEQARKAAAAQNRLLMVKGIAFGVDAAGAESATKGCW